ncbi:MAG: DUF4328 domain-containing protein [Thermoleophilia bacterium]|jgi:hypothetical protein
MSIDNRIKLLLDSWGYVSPDMLTELPENERASALQAYFEQHRAEQPFIMRGETLVAPGSGKSQPPATVARQSAQTETVAGKEEPVKAETTGEKQPPQAAPPGNTQVPPPITHASNIPAYYPAQQPQAVKPPARFNSLSGLALAVELLFWTGIPVNILLLALVLGTSLNKSYHDANTLITIYNLLFGIWGIATQVLLVIWVYRAAVNLRAMNVQGLKYSPGMAVVWFFIPFANFIMPVFVLRELWRGSNPRTSETGDTRQTRVPFYVGVWFLIYVIAGFLALPGNLMVSFGAMSSGTMFLPPGLKPLSDTTKYFLIGGTTGRLILYSIALILGFFFIQTVSKWQRGRGAQQA